MILLVPGNTLPIVWHKSLDKLYLNVNSGFIFRAVELWVLSDLRWILTHMEAFCCYMWNNSRAYLSMVGCPFKTNCQNGPDPVAKSVVVGKSTSSDVNQGLTYHRAGPFWLWASSLSSCFASVVQQAHISWLVADLCMLLFCTIQEFAIRALLVNSHGSGMCVDMRVFRVVRAKWIKVDQRGADGSTEWHPKSSIPNCTMVHVGGMWNCYQRQFWLHL